MQLKGLHLKNFKLFRELDISLTDQKVTVLIGRNGTGKTTLLDALSIGLGGFLSGFDEVKKTRHIDVEEARLQLFQEGNREAQFPVVVTCEADLDDYDYYPINWTRTLSGKKGRTTTSKPSDVLQFANVLEEAVRSNHPTILPVLSYYGTGRLWAQKRDLKREKDIDLSESGSRFLGYTDCLEPVSNEKLLLRWFKRMTLISFQEQQEPGSLTAVRQAVNNVLRFLETDEAGIRARDIFFKARTDELEIQLSDGSSIPVRLMSDGYRSLIGMVADIAYRIGTLNPQLGEWAIRKTPGVVLIDEIDLHLHPKWQRNVIKALTETFPLVQFIVTTHSPFIIQSLQEEAQLLVLEQTRQGENSTIDVRPQEGQFYEMSVEDVTEYLMGIEMPQWSERRDEMYEASKEYYELLHQLEGASSNELQQLRDKLDELTKPFTKNVAYTAFLEQKRLLAESRREVEDHETGE